MKIMRATPFFTNKSIYSISLLGVDNLRHTHSHI